MASSANLLTIELIYALPERQALMALKVSRGTTIMQAIEQSGILQQYSELQGQVLKVGIFGELKPLWQVVAEGDRIEIYRPLTIEPKAARRLRAAKQASKSK